MSAIETETEEQIMEEAEGSVREPTDEEEVETIQLDASLVEKMIEYVDVLLGVRDGKISLTEARALIKNIYPSFGVKKTKTTKKKAKKVSVKKAKSKAKKTSKKTRSRKAKGSLEE